jgi:hypothetical protein
VDEAAGGRPVRGRGQRRGGVQRGGARKSATEAHYHISNSSHMIQKEREAIRPTTIRPACSSSRQ